MPEKGVYYNYKINKTEEIKKMFTVWMFDDTTCDDVQVFAGSLADRLAYVDGDTDLYIQMPDGFTVYAD